MMCVLAGNPCVARAAQCDWLRQGRDGYRLRIGDWRVIYELHDDRLVMLVLEVGPRRGIY
jgi:mRNA-degrading endonuclease RelE of RelBE toxin-antitoxin system